MDRGRALPIIEREAARILEIAASRSVEHTAVVPTCPGWTLGDLLDHVGRVYAMVVTAIGDEAGGPPQRAAIPRRPQGQRPEDWMRQRLDLLLGILSEIPEDEARWNFVTGPRSPVAFWWRRQVHETLIHRVDAELAGGATVRDVEAEAAADGVEECLLVSGFRQVPGGDLHAEGGMTVHLHATDIPGAEWTIGTGAKTYARAHLRADAALRGPAWSLDRWLWRRGSVVSGELCIPDLDTLGDVWEAEMCRPAF